MGQFGSGKLQFDPSCSETIHFPQEFFLFALDILLDKRDMSSGDLPKKKLASILKRGRATYDFACAGSVSKTVEWTALGNDLDDDIVRIRRSSLGLIESDIDMLFERVSVTLVRLDQSKLTFVLQERLRFETFVFASSDEERAQAGARKLALSRRNTLIARDYSEDSRGESHHVDLGKSMAY